MLLVRQYRPAVDRWLLEIPAGTCDVEGEPHETTARRELADRLVDVKIRPDLAEGKGEVAAILAGLTHADNAARANLDAGFLEVTDGLQTILESVRGAMLREEAARAFQIVAVTLETGGLEAIRHLLAFDEAERGVGPGFSTGPHSGCVQ